MPLRDVANSNRNINQYTIGETMSNKTHWALRLFAVTVVSAAVFPAMAERISEKQAAAAASRFVQNTTSKYRKAPAKVVARAVYAPKAMDETLYYVFNNADNAGFTIVSGDDALPQVLGYTTTGSFDAENIPDNMQWWLDGYKHEIEYFYRTGKGARVIVKEDNFEPIEHLMTSTWNQDSPYNNLCPKDESGATTYTGCVATAMAQVIRYMQWPERGVGEAGGVNLSKVPYRYDRMLDRYSSGDNSVNASAVAVLMLHCGLATDMKYSTSGSGTTDQKIQYALINHFNYNPGLKLEFRDYMTAGEWDNKVYNEIAANRPVIMCGTAIGGGHCFVVDGYQGDGYFHLNWGWGGYQDGFFLLYALNPASGGAGSFDGGYNSNQSIITGMIPAGQADTKPQSMLVSEWGFEYAEGTVEDGNSQSKTVCMLRTQRGGMYYNPLGMTQAGKLGVAFENLYDPQDIVYVQSEDYVFDPYYGSREVPFEQPSLPDGEYMVYPVTTDANTGEVGRIMIPTTDQKFISAKVENGVISYENPAIGTSGAKLIATDIKGVDWSFRKRYTTFRLTVANVSDKDWSGNIKGTIKGIDNSRSASTQAVNAVIPAHSSKEVELYIYMPVPEGQYTFEPFVVDKNTEVSGKVTFTVNPMFDFDLDSSKISVVSISPYTYHLGEEENMTLTLRNQTNEAQDVALEMVIMDRELNRLTSYTSNTVRIPTQYDVSGMFAIDNFDLEPGEYYVALAIDGSFVCQPYHIYISRYCENGELAYNIVSEKDKTVELAQPRNGYYMGDVTVPAEIDGYKVKSLTGSAFTHSDKISSVTLPSSVEKIGDGAFYGASSLQTLRIEATVPPTLGVDAFSKEGCESTSIELHEGTANLYKRTAGWDSFHIPSWTIVAGEGIQVTSGLAVNPEDNKVYAPYYVSSDEQLTLRVAGIADEVGGAYIALSDGTVITVPAKGGTVTLPALGIKDGVCHLTGDLAGVADILFDTAASADIYSLQGSVVKRNATAADIRDLAPGIYIIAGRKYIKR